MMPFPVRALAALAAAGLAGGAAIACAARAPRMIEPVHPAAAGKSASFARVRAIFRDSCEHCHNEETAEGSLVLTSYEKLVAGGESGNPIVPRQSASSLLVQAIDGRLKPRMPYKEDP